MRARIVGPAAIIGLLLGAMLPVKPAFAANLRMYNWMQPPSDVAGEYACMTDNWHGELDEVGRAIDWKATCGAQTSGTIYFRSRNAAPDDEAFVFPGAMGQAEQRPPIAAGCGSIHYAWVRIRAILDGINKGVATYQHATVTFTNQFTIYFQGGASHTGARFNQVAIGYEERDSGCSSGYHVHENNRDTQYWDLHNPRYQNATINSLHQNNHKDTWTRRLHWIDVL